MRISDFKVNALEKFSSLEIEDRSFFLTIRDRMIEDVTIVVVSVVMYKKYNEIDQGTMLEGLRLITAQTDNIDKSELTSGVVPAHVVRDLARSPFTHTTGAIETLSRFINYQLIDMLRTAAEEATEETLPTIKVRHFFRWCERAPWPINRWC